MSLAFLNPPTMKNILSRHLGDEQVSGLHCSFCKQQRTVLVTMRFSVCSDGVWLV